ncbi:MAG: phospholipid carrier-dependent glycosyltransferase [Acidobacteria bacterium]|nr:phospholipid carrier-dependent glycosyltransferase [Acidobacteriota bacterium]
MGRTQFPRFLLGSLFAISLALRLLVLGANLYHPHPHFFEPDSTDYIRDADNLSHGKGLRDLEGAPSLRRPPGYSAVLATLFALRLASPTSPVGAILLQLVLSAVSVPLASWIAFQVGGMRPALLTGILLALEPSGIASANFVMSETLYTFTLMCALVAWDRWWKCPKTDSLILLAALSGVLPLIRPAGIYLPILFSLLILGFGPTSTRRLRAALLFLALSLIPVGAWLARNYVLLDSTEVSSIGPWVKALFAHTVEVRAGEASPQSAPWSQEFAKEQGLPVARAMELQNAYFRETVTRRPLFAMERFFLNALAMVGAPNDRITRLCLEDPPDLVGGSVRARLSWLRAVGPLSLLLLLGMVVSLGGIACLPLLLLRGRAWDPFRRSILACLVTVVLYHWGVSSIIQYQADRYRIPMIPLLAVSLALGVFDTVPRKKREFF